MDAERTTVGQALRSQSRHRALHGLRRNDSRYDMGGSMWSAALASRLSPLAAFLCRNAHCTRSRTSRQLITARPTRPSRIPAARHPQNQAPAKSRFFEKETAGYWSGQNIGAFNSDTNAPLAAVAFGGVLPVSVVTWPHRGRYSHDIKSIHTTFFATHAEREPVARRYLMPVMGNRPSPMAVASSNATDPIQLGIRLKEPIRQLLPFLLL